jgi:cellulose synthase/poly-beta-1,6-N-acetylglucosamine synthase-like glycosyltransferase
METIEVISLVYFCIALSYVLVMTFLTVGVMLNKTKPHKQLSKLPKVTVLVSARNEENDIRECIESLLNLSYPPEKLQLILINDRSTDKTADVIQHFADKNSHILFLDTKDYQTHLEAKARGISLGMKHATGEWVFITDADARVHPNWLLDQLSEIDGPEIGMLGGPLVVRGGSLLSSIERASWGFVQMFNLGMAGYNKPFICVGPNMAIRKDIYDTFGGLENVNFTVAEDLALFKMVMDSGYKTKTVVSEGATVELVSVPSFKHLFSQQHRWFRGGLEGGVDYTVLLFIAFTWGYIVLSFIWLGWLLSLKYFLIFWLLYAGINAISFYTQSIKMKLKKHVRYSWVLNFYLPFFSLFVLPSFYYKKNIEWAGSGYKITYEKK